MEEICLSSNLDLINESLLESKKILLQEDGDNNLIGLQLVDKDWWIQVKNQIIQLLSIDDSSYLRKKGYKLLTTKKDFKDFNIWLHRLVIIEDQSKIEAMEKILEGTTYQRIGYSDLKLNIEEFLQKYQRLLELYQDSK